jgi:hypothetical protein
MLDSHRPIGWEATLLFTKLRFPRHTKHAITGSGNPLQQWRIRIAEARLHALLSWRPQ